MNRDKRGQSNVGLALRLDEYAHPLETVARVARRTFTPLKTDRVNRASPMVRTAMSYALEHFTDGITLNDLARATGLSKFHFLRTFRDETGITPGAFLKRYRIVRAMEMLVNSDRGIAKIASEVGYKDAAAFSRSFLKTSGTQPHLYRLTRHRTRARAG